MLKSNSYKLPVLLLAAVAFLVHANSLFNGFAWDDLVVIAKNPALIGPPLSLLNTIDTAKGSEITPYFRPLTLLSFLTEHRLHGLTPALMHLTNLLLHTLTTLLVYLLAENISNNRRTALLAGLIFAVHPIQTESIAFLAGGRNTLLAAFFSLSAYLLHRKAVDRTASYYAPISSLLFVAALFSKETAAAIFPFILSTELTAIRKNGPAEWIPSAKRLSWQITALLIYFWLRSQALGQIGSSPAIMDGLLERLANNLFTIPRYLLSIIWPPATSIRYYLPENVHLAALPLMAAWAGILIFAWWLTGPGRSRTTLFGLAWLVAFWLPTSGILPFPSAPMADRYLYLPAIGLWLIVADQTADKLFRTRYGIAIATIILGLFSICSVKQNRIWKNDLTLFSDYVIKNPDSAFGHHNLGTAYLDLAKNLDRAEHEFSRVLAIDPGFQRIHTQIGYVKLQKGDLQGALVHYNEAITQNPADAEALLNRGSILEGMARYSEALADYRRFLTAPDWELDAARPDIYRKIVILEQLLRKQPNEKR